MKIQLLNPSELKIVFNIDDLAENNISLHSFLSNSEKSQFFLKAIIEIAHEDFGFELSKQDFSYEIFCYDYSEFVTIITFHNKTDISKYKQNFIHYEKKQNHFGNSPNTNNLNFNNNIASISETRKKNIFYIFQNIEDFFEFWNYLKDFLKESKINGSLYKHKNKLLLEINISTISLKEINKLLLLLSEINNKYFFSNLTTIRFKEFGNLLSNNILNF